VLPFDSWHAFTFGRTTIDKKLLDMAEGVHTALFRILFGSFSSEYNAAGDGITGIRYKYLHQEE